MSKSVLIIGGGVIGLCAAYYAALQGNQVTVVDRASEIHDGCSFGNAGMIVPSHFIPLAAPGMVALGLKWMWNPESPFYIKPRFDLDLLRWGFNFWRAANSGHTRRSAPLLRDLHLASRACFEELAVKTGNDFGLVKKGLLMLCKTEHTLGEEANAAKAACELGVPAEVLDSKQTAKLEPNVRMDIAGSVYFPKDCHLSPSLFMASLKRQLDALGVRFIWNTEVTGWRIQEARLRGIQTAKGDYTAEEYVLCGGSWSSSLARDLQLNLPMQAGKGYSLTLEHPPRLPEICSIFSEARVAVTPMGTSLRFGGTMEIAGLNEEINPLRVQGIIKSVSKYYPEFDASCFAAVKPWRGLRPCSPDGLPYIGRSARFKNLTIGTGHSMMGLSLGPITGKLIAEILSNERPRITIEALNPDRYQ